MMSAPMSNFRDQYSSREVTPDAPVLFETGMTLRDIEKHVILETLRQQRFNRTRTARVLQIGIRTLQRKLKKYQEDETEGQPIVEDLSAS